MSELKVRPYIMLPSGQCYDRDEADKVIAEKDKEIAQLQAMLEERNKQVGELKKACNDKDDWCLHTLKENRHQKYKRCLAMYHYCAIKALYELDFKGNDVEWKWYSKWMHKWFNLADKFKEAIYGSDISASTI